jgi:hypothetical protein
MVNELSRLEFTLVIHNHLTSSFDLKLLINEVFHLIRGRY